ncbi:MAG TPA: MFS transporter [Candidatus Paceibacterota bacterium]|nr:MFS transporter [Candidatus Paceibacterota bacterium]
MTTRAYSHARRGLYLLNFVFNLSWALGAYFNANFLLSRGIVEAKIGLTFSAAAALAALIFIIAPRLMKRSVFAPWIAGVVVSGIASLLLAYVALPWLLVLAFIIGNAVLYLIGYCLDLFLEDATPEREKTGSVRSIFLTMANLANAIAPFIAGLILATGGFHSLYLTMAALCLPLLAIGFGSLAQMETPAPSEIRWMRVLARIARDRDLRGVFIAQFLLRFFFAAMAVYTPLYLYQVLGFTLEETGIIFTIMLSPYIFIEIPAGRIADLKLGEQEMLVLGFVIVALATGALSFVTSASLVLWAIALFATRVGASFIDIMSETYFFKKVDGSETSAIGAFRMLYPAASILAPALGSLFIAFLPLQYVFLALGIVMLIGIPAALSLHDTR